MKALFGATQPAAPSREGGGMTVTQNEINVGRWLLQYMTDDGPAVEVKVGKLVLGEHHTLVLDPDTRAVLFAVPNCNLSKVETAR